MTICFIPKECSAKRCSFVWGFGTFSFAATTKSAPSIRAEPDNMLAIKLSWPGLSTKLTTLVSSLSLPQFGHFGEVEYPKGSSHFLHL